MDLSQSNKTLRQFEARIKRLLAEGLPPREAVQQAYRKYPVMEAMYSEIQVQLVNEADKGYGADLPVAVVRQAMEIAWAPDLLTLSDRTTRGSTKIVAQVSKSIIDSLQQGEAVKTAALKLFDGYSVGGIIPQQSIPLFLDNLLRVANSKDYGGAAYKAIIRDVQRNLDKLTSQGLKSAYAQVVRAIDSGNEDKLNKAVYAATQERTRYFAERIARTELARAYQDGFLARWGPDEDTVAFRWKLSGNHPRVDICDLYANADLYGLGRGIYPKDKVPLIPAHPHCMCRLQPIITGQLENETPVDRIMDGGREYLEDLSVPDQEAILGVKGREQVTSGQARWTDVARSYSRVTLVSRLSKCTHS
jgi:hypothetical protein